MEDRIKAFIEMAINKAVPVLEEAVPGVFPCITFHFYNDGGVVYSQGKPAVECASCQIDFWYDKKTDKIAVAIKDLKLAIINENTFSNPIGERVFDQSSKKNHYYFTFEFIKESEE